MSCPNDHCRPSLPQLKDWCLRYSSWWSGGHTTQIAWSVMQARTFRWNLTASGPRPNPQGSYHYGMIKPSRTIMLSNSAPWINGNQRYAVNGVSFVAGGTPLKLADIVA
ncbi:SKU5 similar 4 [Artemisia annua]|uniref:SKU5 similar 4 n=1 Tax=Artemisia annua TaxID=35608 RepID=A0A2U1KCZ9_ARTAN|nr:SKU5 similar 4 [Artemisia annua]